MTDPPSLQLRHAYETLYDDRKRAQYDMATFGAITHGPHQGRASQRANLAVEEQQIGLFESISREFGREAKREQEGQERMAEGIRKMNKSLGEIEEGCDKTSKSLNRFGVKITGFVPRVDEMFGKSAAGSSGGEIPPAGKERRRPEQRNSPRESGHKEKNGDDPTLASPQHDGVATQAPSIR